MSEVDSPEVMTISELVTQMEVRIDSWSAFHQFYEVSLFGAIPVHLTMDNFPAPVSGRRPFKVVGE